MRSRLRLAAYHPQILRKNKNNWLELLHERSNVGSLKDLGEMGLLAAIILFSLGSVLVSLW